VSIKNLSLKDLHNLRFSILYRNMLQNGKNLIQGVFEMRAQILITSYWLHVELGKKYLKNSVKKQNDIYFLSYNFF
jgi:hypothetical protein